MALTKASLIDLNANELILDLDADTSITADTDDTIHFKIGGTDRVTIAGSALSPSSSDGSSLGTTALEWSDLFLADGAVINFGDDQDVSLTHVADTGLLLSSTDQLQFGDSGTYSSSSSSGRLSHKESNPGLPALKSFHSMSLSAFTSAAFCNHPLAFACCTIPAGGCSDLKYCLIQSIFLGLLPPYSISYNIN